MISMKEIDKSTSIPIKEQLRLWILKRISLGELRDGDKIPSINTIAHELEISRETVRLSLDGLVAQGILIPEHGKGYFIAERKNRLKRICILARIDGIYIKPIYEGLVAELGASVSIAVINIHIPPSILQSTIENLAYSNAVERLLIVPVSGKEEDLNEYLAPFRRYFKIAWLDRAPVECKDAAFLCDYAACVKIAHDHFNASGIKRWIYFSRNPEDNSVFSAMRRAFTELVTADGRQPDIVSNVGNIINAIKAEGDRRVGIFTETDIEAAFLESRILGNGIKVPDNVSIIGCDNSDITEITFPRISSVDPGFRDIGIKAGAWIKEDLFENPSLSNIKYTAKPVLAVKDSS